MSSAKSTERSSKSPRTPVSKTIQETVKSPREEPSSLNKPSGSSNLKPRTSLSSLDTPKMGLTAISEENLLDEKEEEQMIASQSVVDFNLDLDIVENGSSKPGTSVVTDISEPQSSIKSNLPRPNSVGSRSTGSKSGVFSMDEIYEEEEYDNFDNQSMPSSVNNGGMSGSMKSDVESWDSDFSFDSNDMSLGRQSGLSDFDEFEELNSKLNISDSGSSAAEPLLQVKIRRKAWSKYKAEIKPSDSPSQKADDMKRASLELRRKLKERNKRKRAQSAVENSSASKVRTPGTTPRFERSKSSIELCAACSIEGSANHAAHAENPLMTPRSSKAGSVSSKGVKSSSRRSRKSSADPSIRPSPRPSGSASQKEGQQSDTPSNIFCLTRISTQTKEWHSFVLI